MTAKVIKFPKPNLNDIPAMLRNWADLIDAGTVPSPDKVAIATMHGDMVATTIWGKTTELDAIALFELGKKHYVDDCLAAGAEDDGGGPSAA